MSEEVKVKTEPGCEEEEEEEIEDELKSPSALEREDDDMLSEIGGKTRQEIRDRIKELRDNLPTIEKNARKKPPKPLYTSVAHTFREIYREQKIDFKEFKKKWGETKPKKGDLKKKNKIVHGYMLRPEYIEAQLVYDECMDKNRKDRAAYRKAFPNAYIHWTEMRKITKLENSINPVIQEERRKKEQAKRQQQEKEEDEEVFNRRSKRLRFIPDDVSREMVYMERDVTTLLFKAQEEFQKTVNDLQRNSSLRFQQGYDAIVQIYKDGLMSETITS